MPLATNDTRRSGRERLNKQRDRNNLSRSRTVVVELLPRLRLRGDTGSIDTSRWSVPDRVVSPVAHDRTEPCPAVSHFQPRCLDNSETRLIAFDLLSSQTLQYRALLR